MPTPRRPLQADINRQAAETEERALWVLRVLGSLRMNTVPEAPEVQLIKQRGADLYRAGLAPVERLAEMWIFLEGLGLRGAGERLVIHLDSSPHVRSVSSRAAGPPPGDFSGDDRPGVAP